MFTTHDRSGSDISAPAGGTAILQDLELYWQSLRHAQRLPARNDLAPHQIDAALPHAFILHRVAPGVARIRMAGQQINDLLRMDARGMPFSNLFTPSGRDAISGLIETAFTTPAVIGVDLTSSAHVMRAQLQARMIMLPLADDMGAVSRLLGAIVMAGAIGPRPRRFDLKTGAPLRIDPVAAAKKPDALRPALRLVVNNG